MVCLLSFESLKIELIFEILPQQELTPISNAILDLDAWEYWEYWSWECQWHRLFTDNGAVTGRKKFKPPL